MLFWFIFRWCHIYLGVNCVRMKYGKLFQYEEPTRSSKALFICLLTLNGDGKPIQFSLLHVCWFCDSIQIIFFQILYIFSLFVISQICVYKNIVTHMIQFHEMFAVCTTSREWNAEIPCWVVKENGLFFELIIFNDVSYTYAGYFNMYSTIFGRCFNHTTFLFYDFSEIWSFNHLTIILGMSIYSHFLRQCAMASGHECETPSLYWIQSTRETIYELNRIAHFQGNHLAYMQCIFFSIAHTHCRQYYILL